MPEYDRRALLKRSGSRSAERGDGSNNEQGVVGKKYLVEIFP